MKIKKAFLLAVTAVLSLAVFAVAGCSSSSGSSSSEASSAMSASDTAAVGETDPFYVLIVGNDSRTGTTEKDIEYYSDGTGRSDTIMLMRVDPTTYKVGIVSIPRDTTCELNGSKVKINETYHQNGIEGLKSAIKDLTGVQVKYYFDTTFVGYENFVDSIGGVVANVPINMSLKDIVSGSQVSLTAGDDQTLDGKEALVLARQRKQYADWGDVCRQMQNRAVVEGVIKRVAESDSASMYIDALYAVAKSDMPKDDLAAVVEDFSKNASKISFVDGSGPYEGGTDPDTNEWLTYRDESTWSWVINAIEQGDDPQKIVPLPNDKAAK